jgi:hypothetical protein
MIGNQINFEHDYGQRKTPLLLELLFPFELNHYLFRWAIHLELRPWQLHIFMLSHSHNGSNHWDKINAYGALVIRYEIIFKALSNIE